MTTAFNLRNLSILGILIISSITIMNVGPYFGLQILTLFFFLPTLFILSLKSNVTSYKYGLTKKHQNLELLLFFGFALTTVICVYFKRFDYDRYISALNMLIAAVVAAYIPIGLNKSKKNELYFHVGYIISFLLLIYIEYKEGNFSLIGFYNTVGSRSRFEFNANYYSYISFFANFSLFYLYLEYRKKFLFSLLMVFPLLMVILAFITQSRSGLLFTIINNGLFWFWVMKDPRYTKITKLFRSILLIGASLFFVKYFINIYNQSNIKGRVENNAVDAREVLFQYGVDTFVDHPLIGVGLGQFPNYNSYGLFTHNSYMEALVEHGLLFGGLVLAIFLMPFFKSLKNYTQSPNNQITKLNLLFFSSFLLFNNIYVFYKVSFAMLYFFLIISIQNRLKNVGITGNINKL